MRRSRQPAAFDPISDREPHWAGGRGDPGGGMSTNAAESGVAE